MAKELRDLRGSLEDALRKRPDLAQRLGELADDFQAAGIMSRGEARGELLSAEKVQQYISIQEGIINFFLAAGQKAGGQPIDITSPEQEEAFHQAIRPLLVEDMPLNYLLVRATASDIKHLLPVVDSKVRQKLTQMADQIPLKVKQQYNSTVSNLLRYNQLGIVSLRNLWNHMDEIAEVRNLGQTRANFILVVLRRPE